MTDPRRDVAERLEAIAGRIANAKGWPDGDLRPLYEAARMLREPSEGRESDAWSVWSFPPVECCDVCSEWKAGYRAGVPQAGGPGITFCADCAGFGTPSDSPTGEAGDEWDGPSVEMELDMASGCLDMIREKLENLLGEEAMSATPPMFYPEAIVSACAKAAQIGAATGNPTPPLPLREDGEVHLIEHTDPSSDRQVSEGREPDAEPPEWLIDTLIRYKMDPDSGSAYYHAKKIMRHLGTPSDSRAGEP